MIKNKYKYSIPLFFYLIILSGCGYLQVINERDTETILSLQEIKQRSERIYNFFLKTDINKKEVKIFIKKINDLLLRQNNRGELNKEITSQVRLLSDLFHSHYMDYLKNGIWSEIHFKNCKTNFHELIEIIIESEKSKPGYDRVMF